MTPKSIRGVHAAAVLVAWVLAAASPALGDDPGQPLRTHGRLDGMRFVGMFGPAQDPDEGREDTLFFGDGHFWSGNCVPCGFAPGKYWIRYDGDAIHFRGVMESPARGRFTYLGVVRGGHLSASVNWHKERWYWTIDRDFRFEGTLSGIAVTQRADAVARLAAAEAKLPKLKEICPL